ncbi:WG repeat-containing protein [Hymenobacter glaciei]
MKKLLPLLLLLGVAAHAQRPVAPQSAAIWQQFAVEGKEGYRYGYKDASGKVRIPAKFGNFTNTQSFRHIMAVSESATLKQYYLLKSGRQVGRDSVYMFDYTFDCESEGKIRFKDYRKDRVGFLDRSGRAIIPAMYNYVSPFHNGLAAALIGARRTCWGEAGADTLTCEHPTWEGGRELLINERNEIVVSDPALARPAFLNWYSLQVNQAAPDTSITTTFRAVNGDRYTFTDYQKEFTCWFYDVFVPAVRSGEAAKVEPLCFLELAVASQPFRGWPHFERAAFIKKFYQPTLLPKLRGLRYGAKNVDVFSETLNTLIFDSQNFRPFLTDCGEAFQAKYPTFSLVITEIGASGKRNYGHQQHFAFIRTAKGYRLYCLSL